MVLLVCTDFWMYDLCKWHRIKAAKDHPRKFSKICANHSLFWGERKRSSGGETKRRQKSFETNQGCLGTFFTKKIVYLTLTSKREECVLMVSSKNCWVWGSMTNDLREACKQIMEQFKWQPEIHFYSIWNNKIFLVCHF